MKSTTSIEEELILLNSSQYISLCILASYLLCFSLLSLLLLYFYREFDFIKASQPGMLYLILVGSILGSGRCFIATFPINDTICHVSPFLLFNGTTLIFGSTVVMLWRADKITNSKFKRIVIKENFVIRVVLIMAFVTLLYCCILVYVGGKPYVRKIQLDSSHYRNVCSWHNVYFLYAFLVAICLLVFYGSYLAYKTRKRITNFNESNVFAVGKMFYLYAL